MSWVVRAPAKFSKEFVDEATSDGGLISCDHDTITLHCTNGEWTYRLTDYDDRRGVYRGELVNSHEGEYGTVKN